ncbi:MAG: fluoride efflux transporter CrcB [Bacteroidetes bacterium]|nr:fluoride efflux transporter CrcB [Bacteroidota bacterium]
MPRLAYILLGGAVGAGLRYVVSMQTLRWVGAHFPWGTLTVNVLGSLVAGFLWGMMGGSLSTEGKTHALFFIGLLGAFTTFSTYALDSLRMLQEDRVAEALANVAANNVGALAAVLGGFALARLLFKPAP